MEASAVNYSDQQPETTSHISKILVVDDQKSVRHYLEKALFGAGYRVVSAVNGHEALLLLEKDSGIDLIISDVYMDDINGLELLKICKDTYPHLPVILITTSSNYRIIIEALRLGAFDYLLKPFEIERLFKIIRRAESVHQKKMMMHDMSNFIKNLELDLHFKTGEVKANILHSIICNFLQSYTHLNQVDMQNICLAIQEAVQNAVDHGNLELNSEWKDDFLHGENRTLFEKVKHERLNNSRYADRTIKLKLAIRSNRLWVEVEDEGDGFPHSDLSDSVTGNSYGMGLIIIRELMDGVQFNDKGNKISFWKSLNGTTQAPSST